ncbi:hypothetical protein DYBT9275_01105 [Dyadobacter sp. CECT 9275]|uniref:Lipoprotein n=1 Tax=Dyadobacter helix TaxID=2822344 RepID=A0A916NK65_9BACT|nr:hypothetical protein [Dyadobacter sp. CECT 9275]CAG4993112.1 hypothetical protein DYBT9275_01105 [Dyadobacter sp. CECT 9275]
MKLNICLFFISAVVLASCVDIPDYDNTPKIYYNGVDHYTETDESTGQRKETVIITIDFEDGDGDLGASPAEISNPDFKAPYGSWGNYELVTARKNIDGTWSESILALDQEKWMPILKPDGKPGPIKGKLDLNTGGNPYTNSTVPITFKFKVRIRDRALRVSNQIETDTVILPGYR